MKRIAIGLIGSFIGMLLVTSCLGSEDEIAPSSEVALLSFGIKDLRTTHTDEEKDTTYTTVVSGGTVAFTIDQIQHMVYNSDSIAYGTDISHVLVKVTADGGVVYLKPDGEVGSIEDSIDFTNPVDFRVTSYDGQYTRDYTVSINVHQVDPKKTTWKQIDDANFPSIFIKQRAFAKSDSLFVIGIDSNGEYFTATTALEESNGKDWTTIKCSGIEGAGLSVLLIDDTFYLDTDAGIFRSEDAVEWTAVIDGEEVSTTFPDEGIANRVAWFCQPLRTNQHITRNIFIAQPEDADTCAQVWTRLSSETEWIEIGSNGNNVHGCPNLEDLTVIQYADMMYAFGGKSVGDRKRPLKAFDACYESRDNGVTWKINKESFNLLNRFKNYENRSFSAVAYDDYVWVMWSNDKEGEVWRGRWNGIK